MTVRDYLRVLREQWLVLLLAILLGLGGAAAAFFLRPAEYTAKLTMYVSSQGGDTTSAAYQGAQLSQQRVTSYVELVSSRRVSEDVIRQLRLTSTPGGTLAPDHRHQRARLGTDRRRRGRRIAAAGGRARQHGGEGVHPPRRRAGATGRLGSSPSCRGPGGAACGGAALAVVHRPTDHARPRPARRPRCRRRRGAGAQLPRRLGQVARPAARGCRGTEPGHHRPRLQRAQAAADGARGSAVASFGGVSAAPHQPAVRRRRQPSQGPAHHQLDAERGQDHHAGEPRYRDGVGRQPSAGDRGRPSPAQGRRPAGYGAHRRAHQRALRPGQDRSGDPAVGRRGIRRARQWAPSAEPERAARVQAHGTRCSPTCASSTTWC